MTVTPKPLASAMMVPTRQVTIPTSAGHSVRFTSGIATINDTNDLPYLMLRDDVKLMVTEYAMSWMPDVLDKLHKINADVHWPTDWTVVHDEHGWIIGSPEPPAEPDDDDQPEVPDPEPEPVPAALDEALKGKTGWRKPRAS